MTILLLAVDHVGGGAVVAGRQLVAPAAAVVLVRDAGVLAGHPLLAGRALGGVQGLVVGAEGLGEHRAHLVGPAAVVLDDGVGDVGHGVAPVVGSLLEIAPRLARFQARSLEGMSRDSGKARHIPCRKCVSERCELVDRRSLGTCVDHHGPGRVKIQLR